MITVYSHHQHGKSNLGWLESCFHFSFADYFNRERMQLGALRVINDDLIAPNTGFATHPHKDMEIISYIVQGSLTHTDSMGNHHTLTRGQVQYMSAGTGIKHSEYNLGDTVTRLLQIWILPDKKDYKPRYGDYAFLWENRQNNWLHLVSPETGDAPIKIYQDANLFVIELEAGKTTEFVINAGRQAYLVLIEGEALINNQLLSTRDGLEVVEESLSIMAKTITHVLIIELSIA